MSLRDALVAINQKHGDLTPALVVEEARPKASPLHSHFEWDNSIAGEKWRREQARQLLRSVRVTWREGTDTDPPATLRAYHSIQPDGAPSPVYRHIDDIATDPVAMSLLLSSALREWQRLKRRYQDITEFWDAVQSDIEEHKAS